MKKFIKENWFKLFLVIIVVVVGYYFIFYIPKTNWQNKVKCQELGEKYRQNSLEEFKKDEFALFDIDGYEITYNKKLNTCLYFAQISEFNKPQNVFILDLLTNKVLEFGFGEDVNIREKHKDFYDKKDGLFNN